MTEKSWPLATFPWPPTDEQKAAMIRARHCHPGEPGRVVMP